MRGTPHTVAITVLAAVGTYWFLNDPKQTAGAFFIATVLVLTQVGELNEVRPTIARVFGTLGGAGLLVLIVSQLHSVTLTVVFGCPLPLQLFLLGTFFGVLAVAAKFSKHQWIYYALIMPATALLNGMTIKQASNIGDQRVVDNLVGALLVLIAFGLTVGFARLSDLRERDQAKDSSLQGAPSN